MSPSIHSERTDIMNELTNLRKENLHLRCVMREAAKEINAFWEVHAPCDGLGPHMLLDYLNGKLKVGSETNPYPKNAKEVKDEKSC